MKILHLADLHIGKQVNGFSMLEDQRHILNQILEVIDREHVEVVLIAGDVYDKPIPSADAVCIFDWFLTELAEREKKVLIISGNHDSPERLEFAKDLLRTGGIWLCGSYHGRMKEVELEDQYGTVHFYLLPFVKPVHIRKALNMADITSYEGAVQAVLEQEDINSEVRNVLVSHQFYTASGEEAERSESEVGPVGGIDRINSRILQVFDYAALGHLHGPQRSGRDTVRYAGSPLKYSASEHLQNKSVTLVDICEKGNIKIELVPLKPLRDMRCIRGPLEELLITGRLDTAGQEDYLHVTLTDEEELYDPLGRLRSVYPNVMSLSFENRKKNTAPEMQLLGELKMLQPEELFERFFNEMNGREMTDKQREQIRDMIGESSL